MKSQLLCEPSLTPDESRLSVEKNNNIVITINLVQFAQCLLLDPFFKKSVDRPTLDTGDTFEFS